MQNLFSKAEFGRERFSQTHQTMEYSIKRCLDFAIIAFGKYFANVTQTQFCDTEVLMPIACNGIRTTALFPG